MPSRRRTRSSRTGSPRPRPGRAAAGEPCAATEAARPGPTRLEVYQCVERRRALLTVPMHETISSARALPDRHPLARGLRSPGVQILVLHRAADPVATIEPTTEVD